MKYLFPQIKVKKDSLEFTDGFALNTPAEYLNKKNKGPLEKFYNPYTFGTAKDSEEIRIGIDPLGFNYVFYKTLCYIGIILPTYRNRISKKILKKYEDNIISEKYIKSRITEDYKNINLEEYIPTNLITGNIHELRNLNSKIVACADELINFKSEQDWELTFDKADGNYKKIYVASRLTKFILDKLKLYRPDFFETTHLNLEKSFSIQRSVNKIVKIYRNDFKNKHLSSEGYTEISLNGEKEYFEILMMILIENSIKYSIDPIKLYPGVTIRENDRRNAKIITITVSSFGNLIPLEETEKIFEAGFRSSSNKLSASGTGMGLNNARRLASLYGFELKYICDYPKDTSIKTGWNNFRLIYKIPNNK
ncbi:sensor histidine kinase [Hymenobacter sp. AT01-02]|uniref:sensor histidine kinase n=1 Tax=Hymenobacter sp. AT01-02 TaxID=1571877 RepID=UPI0005F1F197|nr:HAMP domain-containing sensor histidine kinase [Hymenobacter sp. AT01-02]